MRSAAVCLASLLAAVPAACVSDAGVAGVPVAFLSIRSNARCNEEVMRTACTDPEFEAPVLDTANFSVVLDAAGDAWAAQHCDIVGREEARAFVSSLQSGRAGAPAGYTHPDDMMKKYEVLAREHSSVARLIDLTAELGAPETHEGRHIYALKVSDNVAKDEDEPNVLLLHNIHARELITPEVGYDTAERLVLGYAAGDASVRRVVDSQQIYIVVSMNPDGWQYTWSNNNMWRKNRRNNGGTHGVDCNRNFPFGWSGFGCSGSTNGASETYRGPGPASEPETQTVIALIEDRNPAKILDYHSYSRDVRVNYAGAPPNGDPSLPTVIDEIGVAAAKRVAEGMDYIQVRSGACGTEPSHAQNTHGTLAFLVETGRAFQPPTDEMRSELVRVWPGTEWFLQNPIPVMGHVVDHAGNGVEAAIKLPDINFKHGEQMRSSPGTGRFFLWLPAGTHRITASAARFGERTVTVDVVEGASTSVSITFHSRHPHHHHGNSTTIV